MNSALLASLRNGAHILYVRHGEAIVGTDQPYLSFRDCNTQRNLSALGRKQAVYYGNILSSLRIPVSVPVISSPFCRAVETAELAFGRGSVEVDPFLYDVYRLSANIPSSEQYRILVELTYLLETVPPFGVNTLIIAHSFPEAVGLGQIPDMGTVIIKPLGRRNGYETISKLSLEDWEGISTATFLLN